MEERIVTCTRKTKETDISLTLNLDGSGKTDIHTGIGFFDHMLDGFARHGLFDLSVSVKGDLEVDCHHAIEDTGIVLGAWSGNSSITRMRKRGSEDMKFHAADRMKRCPLQLIFPEDSYLNFSRVYGRENRCA